jgi:hypothetical protein
MPGILVPARAEICLFATSPDWIWGLSNIVANGSSNTFPGNKVAEIAWNWVSVLDSGLKCPW